VNFTTREVAKITGLTVRQLEYWDLRGIVKAGIGITGHRQYTEQLAVLLCVCAHLRARGISGQSMTRIIKRRNRIVTGQGYLMVVIIHKEQARRGVIAPFPRGPVPIRTMIGGRDEVIAEAAKVSGSVDAMVDLDECVRKVKAAALNKSALGSRNKERRI
jgi:DNA-binding transcriptional MerR regulator